MGSERSSQTSESNKGSGTNTLSNPTSNNTTMTPQFSAFKSKRGTSSRSFRSISSASPFKNTLTQKAEMVKMKNRNQNMKENQSFKGKLHGL